MAEIRDMMSTFELFQPMELGGALDLLRQHGSDAWILSGGLDTFDWLKDRAKSPSVVVDIAGIGELDGVEVTGDGIRIGAMTSLTDVSTHSEVQTRFPLLAQAAGRVATPQIPKPGDDRRKHLPGHAVLVLPERVAVLPGGWEHLLRERAAGPEP